MRSTSEVGHAKNIANLNVLNTNIVEIGSLYNPSNPKLLLAHLQGIYTTAFQQQENVNTLVAPYSIAVDERELFFEPLSKQLTKLHKAYRATESVTQKQLDDFMTISRKLRGSKKYTGKADTASGEEQIHHSVSQTSYDQKTNNIDLLISLLQNTQNYNPNEVEYQVQTYQNIKTEMLAKTQAVNSAFIPLNNARSTRNHTLYKVEDNLVDIANKDKNYLFTILDPDSVQYKAIARIQFKKIP